MTSNYSCLAGKISMKDQVYQKELGATKACAIRASESIICVKEARTVLIGDA